MKSNEKDFILDSFRTILPMYIEDMLLIIAVFYSHFHDQTAPSTTDKIFSNYTCHEKFEELTSFFVISPKQTAHLQIEAKIDLTFSFVITLLVFRI